MVTSTETKAIETAAAITAVHPHIVALPPVPAFGEVDRCGVFVADYEGAVAAFFAQPGASPHGWEPATHACARFTGAIEAVIARYPSASIAVISHGLVLSLYLSTLTDGPPADIAHWRTVPFASVARVACPENRTRLCVHPFILPDISHP